MNVDDFVAVFMRVWFIFSRNMKIETFLRRFKSKSAVSISLLVIIIA